MHRRIFLGTALAALVALGGCSSSNGTSGGPAMVGQSPVTTVKAADPPTMFDANAAVALPAAALRSNLAGDVTSRFTALRGRTAYIVDPFSLRAVDVLTGQEVWKVGIEGTPADPDGQTGPLLSDSGPRPPALAADGSTVVAAVPVSEPGRGTTAGHEAMAVLAVDTKTGQKRWASTVAVSPKVSGLDGRGAATTVVAVTEKAVVVTYRNRDQSMSAAIDPGTQQVLWGRDDYEAGAVSGNAVVGTDSDVAENPSMVQATAIGLLDGKPRWVGGARSSQATVLPSDPNLIVVDRVDYGSGRLTLLFLDPRTGEERAVFDEKLGSSFNSYGPCEYDRRSVLVCGSFGRVLGFDATSGSLLWSLPDQAANRVAPKVTAVWHGTVYGRTENGPVALSATTGQDLPAQPGAAPTLVSEYAGIGIDSRGTPIAYPATA